MQGQISNMICGLIQGFKKLEATLYGYPVLELVGEAVLTGPNPFSTSVWIVTSASAEPVANTIVKTDDEAISLMRSWGAMMFKVHATFDLDSCIAITSQDTNKLADDMEKISVYLTPPYCDVCGSMTVEAGDDYKCLNCGNTYNGE